LLAREPWNRRIPAALVLLLALCDFAPRRGWKQIEASHRAFEATSRALSTRLPADARLAAPFASWRYSLYLGRPVYTLFFAWVRRGDMSGAEEILDKYRIDRVLLSPSSDADRQMAPYFEQRYGIADRVGDVAVVRVR
jgi:hypothetical protein